MSKDVIPRGEIAPASDAVRIVYDGECPFCSAYVKLRRARKRLGRIELINAREDPELNRRLLMAGANLDEGMAVIMGDQIFLGGAAMSLIEGWEARRIYPWLRRGRNLVLAILGRKTINAKAKTPAG